MCRVSGLYYETIKVLVILVIKVMVSSLGMATTLNILGAMASLSSLGTLLVVYILGTVVAPLHSGV